MRLCKGCGRIQFKAGATCYNCGSPDIVDTRTYATGEAPPPIEEKPEVAVEAEVVAAPPEDDMSDFIMSSVSEPEPEEVYTPEPEPEPVSEPEDDMSDFIMSSASEPEPEPEPVYSEPEEVYTPEPAVEAVEAIEDDMSDFIMEPAPAYESVTADEPPVEITDDLADALAEVELEVDSSGENEEEARLAEEARQREEQFRREQEEREKEEALKAEEERRKEELRQKLEERKKEKEENVAGVPDAPQPEPPAVTPPAEEEEEEPDDEPAKKDKPKKHEPPKTILKSGTDPKISKLTGNPHVDYLEMLFRHGRDALFLIGAALYTLFSMAMLFINIGETNDDGFVTVLYIIMLFPVLWFAVGFLFNFGSMRGKIKPLKKARGLSFIKRALFANVLAWVSYAILHFYEANANIGEVLLPIAAAALGIVVSLLATKLIDSLVIIITTGKYYEHIILFLPIVAFAAAVLEIIDRVMTIVDGNLIAGALGIVRVIGAVLMTIALFKFSGEYKRSIEG